MTATARWAPALQGETDARNGRLAAGTALTGMFAVELNFTVLVALVPFVAHDLDSSPALIAWIVTGPLILRAVLVPIAGGLTEAFHLRTLWLVACAVASIGWAMTATASDAATLIAWRTVAATAETLILPLTLLILARSHAVAHRGRMIGYWSGVLAFAPLVGLLLGSWLTHEISWRVVFLLQVPAGIVAFTLGFHALRRMQAAAHRRFDILGAACLAAALAPFVLFLTEGPEWGFGSAPSLATIATSAAACLVFVAVERRAGEPLVPLVQLRSWPLSSALVVLAAANAAFMCGFFVSAFIVQALGYDGSLALVAVAPRAFTFGLTSLIAGSWARRWPSATVCAAGLITIAASLAILALMNASSGYGHLLIGLVLSGIGLGLVMPSAVDTALAAGKRRMGAISGLTLTASSVGSTIGIAMAVAFIGSGAAAGWSTFGAFARALVVGALLCLTALIALRGARVERPR